MYSYDDNATAEILTKSEGELLAVEVKFIASGGKQQGFLRSRKFLSFNGTLVTTITEGGSQLRVLASQDVYLGANKEAVSVIMAALARRDDEFHMACQELETTRQNLNTARVDSAEARADLSRFKDDMQEALSSWVENAGNLYDRERDSLSEVMEELGLDGLVREWEVEYILTYRGRIVVKATTEDKARNKFDNLDNRDLVEMIDTDDPYDIDVDDINEAD